MVNLVDDIPRGVAAVPWAAASWGNHRVVLHVDDVAYAVIARIPWRRVDAAPEQVGMRLVHAESGAEVRNVLPLSVTREVGDIVFQAALPGEYHLYYLPCEPSGPWYHPNTAYRPTPGDADPTWQACAAADLAGLPRATVLRIEARTNFDRFDPMEVIATETEMHALRSAHAGQPCLVFPEDRAHPIRMRNDLPRRWIACGSAQHFQGTVQPGEYYIFQLGIYALNEIANLAITWSDLTTETGATISADDITCFNLGGVNWLGQSFSKHLGVPEGQVQACWFGVEVPLSAVGRYTGVITLHPDSAHSIPVTLTLEIDGEPLTDHGDAELWRLSRLRWLNSTMGIDDEPTAGYPPLALRDRTVRNLGHAVTLGAGGLPASILSYYATSGERLCDQPTELLAAPMRFVAETHGSEIDWQAGAPEFTTMRTGRIAWASHGQSGALALACTAEMAFDGYLEFRLTVTASEETALTDLRLEMPLRAEAVAFMMGMGREGGLRPTAWRYRWDLKRANHAVWLGAPHAGVQCKLQYNTPVWELYSLEAHGLPDSWDNGGCGGCDIDEQSDGTVRLTAFSGERTLQAGASVTFTFDLLLTPVKLLDSDAHWQHRYCHPGDANMDTDALIAESEATLVNLHHSFPANPYINYPFRRADALSAFTAGAAAHGLKTNLYYTVRELSVYAEELWALRSLGAEIYRDGPGFCLADQFTDQRPPQGLTGGAWLCEHLRDGYMPAWHCTLAGGGEDLSIATVGLSRWHNYYLEGLGWLLRETGVSGLYLDGVGYDRQIMQRVRKVMDRTRPGGAIDFHSGNNFHPDYGLSSPANQYLELFPYLTSVWFGEGYDYGKSPDFWLVEVSGIPFGLMGDMLDGGGHPWRGMVYGMSMHLYHDTDPRPLWRLWDALGLPGSRLVGYWTPECPVRVDHPAVRASCYVKPGYLVVALASWTPEPVTCRLSIDWDALGLQPDGARLVALPVAGFQPARSFDPSEPIVIDNGRGWVLRLEN